MRSSSAAARRDIARRFQIGSTAHDRRRPVTTLQRCSQLPLRVDQRRACSANDHSRAPAHGRGNGNRNWFIASPGSATTLSRSGPHLAVTMATPQPVAPSSQIPIAPARTTTVPMPARGFLPRGLSDACPRSAPHRQVTGRHLITLNDSGHPVDRSLGRRVLLAIGAGQHVPSISRIWRCARRGGARRALAADRGDPGAAREDRGEQMLTSEPVRACTRRQGANACVATTDLA